MLSEAPERTLRMSALAARTNASLARLSHVVQRLETRGLVRREPCAQDRRATNAVLTSAGWDAVVAAAPGHVATVRRLVIDPLSASDVAALDRITARILGRSTRTTSWSASRSRTPREPDRAFRTARHPSGARQPPDERGRNSAVTRSVEMSVSPDRDTLRAHRNPVHDRHHGRTPAWIQQRSASRDGRGDGGARPGDRHTGHRRRPVDGHGHGGPDDYHLTVMGTTDLHGSALNWDYFKNAEYDDSAHNDVGLAKVSTLVNQVRADKGKRNTLLIDAGDTIQGTSLAYYYAKVEPISQRVEHPMAAAMNAIGYDAAAVGNHEFNYGIPYLRTFEKQLDFPLLAANALDDGTGRPAFQPYVIKTVRPGRTASRSTSASSA